MTEVPHIRISRALAQDILGGWPEREVRAVLWLFERKTYSPGRRWVDYVGQYVTLEEGDIPFTWGVLERELHMPKSTARRFVAKMERIGVVTIRQTCEVRGSIGIINVSVAPLCLDDSSTYSNARHPFRESGTQSGTLMLNKNKDLEKSAAPSAAYPSSLSDRSSESSERSGIEKSPLPPFSQGDSKGESNSKSKPARPESERAKARRLQAEKDARQAAGQRLWPTPVPKWQERFHEILSREFDEEEYCAWFFGLTFRAEGNTVYGYCSTSFRADWMTREYTDFSEEVISKLTGNEEIKVQWVNLGGLKIKKVEE